MQKTKINRSDLKIFPSERLTDNDDGGGMPLGKAINGVANELFNPISSIARVNGGFFLRKIFMGVQRADKEPLIGAFTAITKPPKDESVSYLLFPATKFGESRADIVKRIEAYYVPTIASRMTLMSNQSAGAKVIQAYQNVGEPLPMVGDVYHLKQDKAGYPKVEQSVQIVKVDSENRKFNDGQKDFYKTVLKLEITNPLKTDFIGAVYPVIGYADVPCKVLEMGIADAGRYYGVKPLAKEIRQNMQTLQVTGIMEKLVPVNQVENALIDVNVGTMPINVNMSYGEIIDNGVKQSTIMSLDVPVQSYLEYVKSGNLRSRTYTAQLLQPRPNTVVAKFLSQGNWYELKDDGKGKMVGASGAYGGGTVDYATGSMTLSTGELPDVGSAVIVNYVKDVYQVPTDATITAYLPIKLAKKGSQITVTNNGKTGRVVGNQITGDITGEYDIHNNVLKLSPTLSRGEIVVQIQNINAETTWAQVPYTIADSKVKATGSENMNDTLRFDVRYVKDEQEITATVFANGNGLFISEYQKRYFTGVYSVLPITHHKISPAKKIGTVDYQTGQILFDSQFTVTDNQPIYEMVKIGEYKDTDGLVKPIESQTLVQNIVSNTTFDFAQTASSAGKLPLGWYLLTGVSEQQTFSTPNLTVEIGTTQTIVDNSLYFTLGNTLYRDENGKILQGQNQVGTRTGNSVTLTDFVMASPTLKGLLVKTGDDAIKQLVFTMPTIRPSSLKMSFDGEFANSDLKGVVYIEDSGIHKIVGSVNSETGIVQLYNFSQLKTNPPRKITYQAVALSYLPVDNDVVKIDTVRLPPDGRVPIFRRGDTILISNTQTQNLGSAFTANQTVRLERGDLDRICLQDSSGRAVLADLWQYDLQAGSITFAQSLDLSDYQMPLIAKHTQEEKNRVLAVDIDGTLSLQFATKRAYGLDDTFVSSVLIGGDLQVNVSVPFTQRSWNNVWQDTPVGEQLLNKLNVKDYPIVLTDDGAIDERWVIIWKSSSQFELYGETVGFVMKTDTLQDLAPINPATKKPYFTIPRQAFGADAPWSVGDVIRFNTDGTLLPVWVICAVQPTANPLNEEDGFTVCLFGDTTEV